MKLAAILMMISFSVMAQQPNPYNELTAEDQKYYKNEFGTGMNQLERIDSTVKEINKLHGEIAGLKAEVQSLKKDIEELKKKK